MKRLTAGFVLIVAVLAAAPYWIGLRVETLFHRHVARISAQTGLAIEVLRYQRGWFESRAVTRINLPGAVTLKLRHHIIHGPYAVLGWAEVESTPVLEDNPRLAHYFGDKPAVTIHTRIAFDGSVTTRAHSPAFRQPARTDPDVTVTWGGAKATVRFGGGNVHYTVTAPKLKLAGPDRIVSISGMKLEGTGAARSPTATAAGINWHTETRVRVQRFLLRDPSQNVHVQTSLSWHIETGLGPSGHYGVDSRLRIANTVIQTPRGDRSRPFKLDKAVVKIGLQGIDTQALSRLENSIGRPYGQPGPMPVTRHRIFAILLTHLPELLSSDAELTIRIPVFASNYGHLGLRARVSLSPPGPGFVIFPRAIRLLRRLNISLRAFADKRLLQFMTPQTHLLQSRFARHWLELDDGRYTLRIHLGPQRFTINGQPAPGLLRGLAGAA